MKKYTVISLLGILTLSFLVFSVPAGIAAPVETGTSADTLLVGTTSFGGDLDPANSWDSASSDIIIQVVEGLFTYDYGDKYLRIVPRLAADCGTWSDDNLEFTVTLREGITFHNGNPMNADAVVATFDRLHNLIEGKVIQTAELYEPLQAQEVINKTEAIDEYTVKFTLNYKYAVFVPLLTFTASFILDVTTMPADTIISTNDTLVGTGPYKFLGNDGEKVEFEAYADYFRGVPAVKKFTYVKYETISTIATALLAGDIHMGSTDPDFLVSFMNSDILVVEERLPGTTTGYIGFNNVLINKTMRQAMVHAFDYDYYIHNIYKDLAVRMTSPVPPGIAFHQAQDVPTYDIAAARVILIDAGLSKGLDEDSEDSEWIALTATDPIASYNYSYNLGNLVREDIGVLAKSDLAKIGIELELTGSTWSTYVYKLYFYHERLNVYYIGWMPDYNDPSNYLNPMFSNTSMGNGAQVNDPEIQALLDAGIVTFDNEERREIYYELQKLIVELTPWAFVTYSAGVSTHSIHVSDLQRNAMGYLYIFPITWYGDEAEWDEEEYCNTGSAPLNATDLDLGRGAKIPGYTLSVMLGVATATVIAIIKKKRK